MSFRGDGRRILNFGPLPLKFRETYDINTIFLLDGDNSADKQHLTHIFFHFIATRKSLREYQIRVQTGFFCTIDAAKTCNGQSISQVAQLVQSLGSD